MKKKIIAKKKSSNKSKTKIMPKPVDNIFGDMAKRFTAFMQYIEIIKIDYGKRPVEKCYNCKKLTNNYFTWSKKTDIWQKGAGYFCDDCWIKEKNNWFKAEDWDINETFMPIPRYAQQINELLF